MSMLRFKVGDLARLTRVVLPSNYHKIGKIVEIGAVGPFQFGQWFKERGEWFRSTAPGLTHYSLIGGGLVTDDQLSPIDPPAEPASLTRQRAEELTA